MDGSANPPPAADAQPDYPPMPPGGDIQALPHAPPQQLRRAPSSGYGAPAAHRAGAPPGSGIGAMGALTAAAAAVTTTPTAPPAAQQAMATLLPPSNSRGAPPLPSLGTIPPRAAGGAGPPFPPRAAGRVPPGTKPPPQARHHVHAQPSAGAGGGPPAPVGKVVESGHEHTGRWTKEEHEAFLAALQLYGKEWKKVAARVKTRTVVQTRTHAQKYFQKLQKVLEAGGEKEANAVLGMVGGSGIGIGASPPASMTHTNMAAIMADLGAPSSSDKKTSKKRGSRASISSAQKKQQQQHQYQPSAAALRSNSAGAAALLNMSSDRRLSTSSVGQPVSAAAGAYAVAHPAPSASSQPHRQHGFAPATASTSTVADVPTAASTHGFGYPAPSATAAEPAMTQPLSTGRISIVAPTHDDMVQAGKFPEPSPAACGKRKLAEIAAAQMLAGVVGATAARDSSPSRKRASIGGTAAVAAAAASAMAEAPSAEASLPEPSPVAAAFPVVEANGGVTPPQPPTTLVGHSTQTPSTGNSSIIPGSVGGGMSLQIVNPDSLVGIGNGMARRRLINGQASPSTPWDGQLEALVSQVKSQDPTSSQDPNTINNFAPANEPVMSLSDAAEVMAVSQVLLPLPLRSPRSSLQIAVCNGYVNEVSQICSTLAGNNTSVINERDDAGFNPLHSAAALGLMEMFGPNSIEASEICRLLLDCGADLACRDPQGSTPVHWAARAGHCDILSLLLMRSCPLDAPNDAGETALHWAMRAGDKGADAVKFLVENGARVNVFNRDFKRPLDVAAEGFSCLQEEGDPSISQSPVDQRIRRSTRWNLMRYSSQCRTLVLHHWECLDHLAKADHDWEVPDRIENIISTVTSRTSESCDPGDDLGFVPCEMTISTEFERATLELLSRIHSAEYLAFVNDLSKELERKRKQQLIDEAQSNASADPSEKKTVVPFTPMVQRKILKEEKTKDDGHSDTAFSAGSLKAARRAAGAVQHAVDCVLVGRNRNAFCIVRPPGHHAGINGLLSDAESCGFCLFNNVAAGAMHALSDEKHRPRAERCAIVDIDAHHGNGTEEIVRKCHDSGRLLFFSVHLYDHDKPKKGQAFQYKFYPGTGAEDDVAHNIINVPIAPLWREKEVVKSISLASNGGAVVPEPRQTRQRSKEEAARRVPSLPDFSKYNSEESMQASALKPSTGASETASVTSDSSQSSKRPPLPTSSPHYPPHYLMGVGRLAYRRAIQHRLLPALRAFNPDLIILSTGLDAARGDVGNARHFVNGTEAMGLDLEPEDYAWTARKVCEVADICCDGRVVSVLEGGYGRTPPTIPAPPLLGDETGGVSTPVKQKLDKSFFSECALQHLKGLVDPYYAEDEQQEGSSIRKRP
ncbi:hypothetical protein ACHAWF_012454 [Thalassiosira exigua]